MKNGKKEEDKEGGREQKKDREKSGRMVSEK